MLSPSGGIEVISMAMKTEYRIVTTVEEALNYIGDSQEGIGWNIIRLMQIENPKGRELVIDVIDEMADDFSVALK